MNSQIFIQEAISAKFILKLDYVKNCLRFEISIKCHTICFCHFNSHLPCSLPINLAIVVPQNLTWMNCLLPHISYYIHNSQSTTPPDVVIIYHLTFFQQVLTASLKEESLLCVTISTNFLSLASNTKFLQSLSALCSHKNKKQRR